MSLVGKNLLDIGERKNFMKTLFVRFVVISFLVCIYSSAFAAEMRPVMVYDSDVIMDKSWNEAIHRGIVRFEKKMNIDVKEISLIDVPSFTEKVSAFIKAGYSPIMLNNVDSGKDVILKDLLHQYPKTRFVIFNGTFNIPNAYYFIFANQEASFLAGYLASKKTQTGKLGFVGGMDIAVIRNFLCGYIKGARYQNADIEVEYDFIGTDFLAWSRPEDAHKIALRQIDNGADIIFSPSGASSVGALRAAHEKGVFGIGVDSNQNSLFPGTILTSTLARVDNAVFRSLLAVHRNIWGDQVKNMGLQENGVGLAFDKYNAPLVSSKLREEIEGLKEKIILKEIELGDYMYEESCEIDGEVLF